MPSNSSDFNQILRHMQTMQKCHQGQQPQSGTSKLPSTPARILEISLIFERVLDAFKLIRFQPNLKHNSLRACEDHAKHHQGQKPQSGTSKSSSTPARIPEVSEGFWGRNLKKRISRPGGVSGGWYNFITKNFFSQPLFQALPTLWM